jgi:hypothetical protein
VLNLKRRDATPGSVPPLAGNEVFWDYLRWHAYLSARHRLLFVATPKAACTTLLWWLARLEGYDEALRAVRDSLESDPELVIHDSFKKVAPHVNGLLPEALAEALVSDTWFRFAVVRNPFPRIFSAWQSKLLLREPLQSGPYIECEFFNVPVRSGKDVALAFEGFLEYLAAHEAPTFRDPHWTPQVHLLRPDLVSYDQLAHIEDPISLRQALAGRVGHHVGDPFAGRTNESLIPYLPALFTERTMTLVRSLYADDFEVFGYSLAPPPGSSSFSDAQMDVALKAVGLIRARHRRLAETRALLSERIETLEATKEQPS